MNYIAVPMLTKLTDHLYDMRPMRPMRPMKEPATAAWGLRISDTDVEKLKAGLKPMDMDDKWHIYVSATEPATSVHIARSIFGVETYVVHVLDKTGDEGSSAEIASITWETNKNGVRISLEQAKKEVVNLTRSILGCEYEALPDYAFDEVWDYYKLDSGNIINEDGANGEH